MNESARLADIHRHHDPGLDLLDLLLRISTTPCNPSYRRNVHPDQQLAAILRADG